MKPAILAASLAAAASLALPHAALAQAQDILTPYGHITVLPGESIHQAMMRAARANAVAKPPSGAKVHAMLTDGQPAINSGAMVSSTLEVGDATSVPVIQFNYATGPAGLSAVGFTFTSPNGQADLNLDYYAGGYPRRGTIVLAGQSGAPYFAQPGKWTLSGAVIVDNDENYVSYTAAQAAALIDNPVINVVNKGPVDITPPVVTAGKVLTPTISLSSAYPQFRATLSGTDNLSGIAFGYVIIQAPNVPYGQTQTSFAPIAFTSGTLEAAAPIFAGSAPGTYSITGFELCDVAGNCSSYTQTSAQIQALFGTTTFTVTK